jgi:arginine decarboxylase
MCLDLTELPGLDNFHQPDSCIAASQRLAAERYGSSLCLYSVNGSTAAIMAAIWATVGEEDAILFAGPFHQSAWRGLVWAGARPRFGVTGFHPDRLLTRPPTAAEVAAWLEDGEPVKAVYLTSPSYQGEVADVAAIAEVVHAHGLPLIVDEAHGAHFGLAPGLPPHSVAAGADLVIHSVHKMLPGLTQTAWLHAQGERVDLERLTEGLRFLHSTSPSYLLLASLDAAQAWLREQGPAVAAETLERLRSFGLLEDAEAQAGRIPRDPLRQWLPTGNLAASRRLQETLAARGLYVEYADSLGVLSIFGLGVSERTLARYCEVVAQWQADGTSRPHLGKGPADAADQESAMQYEWLNRTPDLALAPREVARRRRVWMPIAAAAGEIAAGMVTPYPPGVPLVYPGQRLDPELLAHLAVLHQSGYETHGISANGEIAVVR